MGGLGSYVLAAKLGSGQVQSVIPICGEALPYCPLLARQVPCYFVHAANDKCIDVKIQILLWKPFERACRMRNTACGLDTSG